jgi:hypothetical protein
MIAMTIGLLGATVAFCQILPLAGLKRGPGVQAPQDAREADVLKACKTPPPAPAGRSGRGRGPAPANAAGPRDYTVTEIAGVIAAGRQWSEVWEVDGGLLIAQNNKSNVVKLDKNGKGLRCLFGHQYRRLCSGELERCDVCG